MSRPPSRWLTVLVAGPFVLLAGCRAGDASSTRSFEDDVRTLAARTETVVLGEAGGPRVAVTPEWRGSVVTSTAGGDGSHGAFGRDLAGAEADGGEDLLRLRFEDVAFPERFEVVASTARRIDLRHEGRVSSRAGTSLAVRVDRSVRLLEAAEVVRAFDLDAPPPAPFVAYESSSTLTNVGDEAWTEAAGAPSVGLAGRFRATDSTTVVVPFSAGGSEGRGRIVDEEPPGTVSPDRLVVDGDGVLFVRADGRLRSRIDIDPRRARPVVGGYDPSRGLLTLVSFAKSVGAGDAPIDAVTCANGASPADASSARGPCYELGTPSSVVLLAPGASVTLVRRTLHVHGDATALRAICERVLGVAPRRVARVFGAPRT